ncbi:MAG: hypothetical protein LBQ54_12395 [Planctomycetaceae bacterium]|jgi:hypothetical protein|nr:hypothetical protein [Planctomycetaceae bacterium]
MMELRNKLLQIAALSVEPDSLPEAFDKTAVCLLNRCRLVIGKEVFRLQEVEFYFSSEHYGHVDPYSHSNLFRNCVRQGEFAVWYFHRFKSAATYPRQKFRGLDLTIGNKDNDVFGGILLRTIQSESLTIDGPGKIVSHLETVLGVTEIERLAAASGETGFHPMEPLKIEATESRNLTVFKSRRVLPKPNRPEKNAWFDKKLRYYIDTEIEVVQNDKE